jgi:hypothetical protein
VAPAGSGSSIVTVSLISGGTPFGDFNAALAAGEYLDRAGDLIGLDVAADETNGLYRNDASNDSTGSLTLLIRRQS